MAEDDDWLDFLTSLGAPSPEQAQQASTDVDASHDMSSTGGQQQQQQHDPQQHGIVAGHDPFFASDPVSSSEAASGQTVAGTASHEHVDETADAAAGEHVDLHAHGGAQVEALAAAAPSAPAAQSGGGSTDLFVSSASDSDSPGSDDDYMPTANSPAPGAALPKRPQSPDIPNAGQDHADDPAGDNSAGLVASASTNAGAGAGAGPSHSAGTAASAQSAKFADSSASEAAVRAATEVHAAGSATAGSADVAAASARALPEDQDASAQDELLAGDSARASFLDVDGIMSDISAAQQLEREPAMPGAASISFDTHEAAGKSLAMPPSLLDAPQAPPDAVGAAASQDSHTSATLPMLNAEQGSRAVAVGVGSAAADSADASDIGKTAADRSAQPQSAAALSPDARADASRVATASHEPAAELQEPDGPSHIADAATDGSSHLPAARESGSGPDRVQQSRSGAQALYAEYESISVFAPAASAHLPEPPVLGAAHSQSPEGYDDALAQALATSLLDAPPDALSAEQPAASGGITDRDLNVLAEAAAGTAVQAGPAVQREAADAYAAVMLDQLNAAGDGAAGSPVAASHAQPLAGQGAGARAQSIHDHLTHQGQASSAQRAVNALPTASVESPHTPAASAAVGPESSASAAPHDTGKAAPLQPQQQVPDRGPEAASANGTFALQELHGVVPEACMGIADDDSDMSPVGALTTL